MGVETATYVNDLDSALPGATDLRSQGDDHLRLLKAVLKATFPSANRAWRLPRFASKNANYSVLAADDETIFLVDTSGGNVTMTLPAVPSVAWRVTIIKVTSDANQVVISGTVGGGSLTNLKSNNELYIIGGNGTAFYDLSNVLRNSSVTYAKMQNVTNARLLGNNSGGAAAPSEIDLDSTTLEFADADTLRVKAAVLSDVASVNKLHIVNNTGTPNSKIDFTADSVKMVDSSNRVQVVGSFSRTCDMATNGGLDALEGSGSKAADTWYFFWAIGDGTNDRVVGSVSASAPTMPGIYTYKAYLGAMKTDGSGNFYRSRQRGNKTQFNGSTGPRQVTTTGAGSVTALSLTTFVPSTASGARVSLYSGNLLNNGSIIALSSVTFASLGIAQAAYQANLGGAQAGQSVAGSVWIDAVFDTAQEVYYQATGGANDVRCHGWTDGKVNAS